MDLDRFIAEKVMNNPWVKPNHGPCCTCQTCGYDHDDCQCGYTEDIGMVFNAVDRMRELGWFLALDDTQEWFYRKDVALATDTFDDKNIATAICLAAKAALEDS